MDLAAAIDRLKWRRSGFSCRQRSTWLGPSARGSSNKDQPVRRTEQSTGHLLHTHVHTHTSFTHAHSHAGVHICSQHAGRRSYVQCEILQRKTPRKAAPRHKYQHTCVSHAPFCCFPRIAHTHPENTHFLLL